ncbi:MAG: hypothetical protein U1D41_09540 [Nitrosomonas sp.]|uniref:hypothetical protein n=1 Tax=Nitrosomonas sp. TaxID=42353 RepID=UPI002ABC00D6|nr:hypothetical protein [Nitrosomonas sp.]MDZ4106383.1 hypothetical protein [Nitrosomonas sp.]
MANPARLVAGAMGVYGEAEFRRVYGEIYPIDANRIIEAPDESRIVSRQLSWPLWRQL